MSDAAADAPRGCSRADLWWLVTALGAGSVVAAAHLYTHPYPAYDAGLSLDVARGILADGYRLPHRVPTYAARDAPFLAPPLAFYLAAVLMEYAGVAPVAIGRFAPPVLSVCYLLPYYLLARELLGDRTAAGVATVLLAVTPSVLQWHLSADGLVRATAFLFALTGLYTGVRLFRGGGEVRGGRGRWLVASAVLFGLTILTHPTYALFLGLSYLVFYLGLDRSGRGGLAAVVVALGGGALATPWLAGLVDVHGRDALRAVAGAHWHPIVIPDRLLGQFVSPLATSPPMALFFLLSFGGLFYVLGRRRLLLPAWLIAAAVVVGEVRFQFVPGSMLAAAFVLAVIRDAARAYFPAREWRRSADIADAATVGVGAVVLVGVVIGVLFGAAALPAAAHGSPAQPQFMTSADRTAMTWVATHTGSSATFAVLGDAAEWFPLVTDRTLLAGPRAVELTTPGRSDRPLPRSATLSTCESASCVTHRLQRAGRAPDYLYVPKGNYTARGVRHDDTTALRRTLDRSDRYRLVYENRGAAIYRIVDRESASTPAPATHASPAASSVVSRLTAGASPRPTPG